MSSARAPSEQATDFQVQALDLRKNIAAALVVCQPNGRFASPVTLCQPNGRFASSCHDFAIPELPLSRASGLCNLLTTQGCICALNGLR